MFNDVILTSSHKYNFCNFDLHISPRNDFLHEIFSFKRSKMCSKRLNSNK